MLSHNNPARVNPWYGFYLFLLFFTQWGKPSVAFQNSEKRALWSMDGSSCISKLWFWLIKNATVHMGLCFLLRRETNRFLCVGGELQIPPPLLQPHWATSLPPKTHVAFLTPACVDTSSWRWLPCVLKSLLKWHHLCWYPLLHRAGLLVPSILTCCPWRFSLTIIV